jgi:hypothetical protein
MPMKNIKTSTKCEFFCEGYYKTSALKAYKANDEKLAKIPHKLGVNYLILLGRGSRNRT